MLNLKGLSAERPTKRRGAPASRNGLQYSKPSIVSHTAAIFSVVEAPHDIVRDVHREDTVRQGIRRW